MAKYKGWIGNSYVEIELMNSEEAAHHVIDILTKINHVNIVKLEGYCYGSKPYLVYEFAEYGSLRDCLSNAKIASQLTWEKRIQIAIDLAVGIHYIHCCTNPAYIHQNINSRNVVITMDWRAKIYGFRSAKLVTFIEEMQDINLNDSVMVEKEEYFAPEYLTYGLASLKVDIFGYGVVLLELLSSRKAITDGILLKDSVNFFG
ncbi:Receptor-like protein kinase [Quillaja saponaria]|uniref:Receptor-like protein kinase n=1 Tax=Quillaja saponaria TaxID=32244 RepID=A0AAD7LDQ7_QUISA|nr:Receptor-like protein kinase [Quillaja saponaria]